MRRMPTVAFTLAATVLPLTAPSLKAQQPRDPRGATPEQLMQRVIAAVPDTFRIADRGGNKPRVPSECKLFGNHYPTYLDCYLEKNNRVGGNVRWYQYAYTTHRDGSVERTVVATVSFKLWSDTQKNDLRQAFEAARQFKANGLQNYGGPALDNVPVNHDPIVHDADVKTALDEQEQAWPMYVATVGMMLAAEVDEWYPWSISSYEDADIATLLDGTRWFNPASGIGDQGSSWSLYPLAMMLNQEFHDVTPAPPNYILKYEAERHMIGDTPLDTAARVLDWSRWNLTHYEGDWLASNMEAHWGYRGLPPLYEILQTHPWPAAYGQVPGQFHFTAACHGTTSFLKGMLRVLNIPVVQIVDLSTAFHSVPYFPTLHTYLTHGDDPYDSYSKGIHPFPAKLFFIDDATFAAWFPADGSGKNNLGRRTADLMAFYPTQFLVQQYCADTKAGRSHATGDVYLKNYVKFHTVAELEAWQLWERLQAEASLQGLSCQ